MEKRGAFVDFDAILERLNLIPDLVTAVQSLRESLDRERPEVMDYREAARHLKLGVTTLQQYVLAGTIPHYKIGAAVRFERSELDAWMMSKRIDIGGRSGRATRENGRGKVGLVSA